MRWEGVVLYFTSLFLLYASTDVGVALTVASVSLSVMYVWTAILRQIQWSDGKTLEPLNGFLVANLLALLASAFVVSTTLAILLLLILVALSIFLLPVHYGLKKEPAAEKADLKLRWFGVLLLGFFSLNPFIEGVSASNWVEAIAAIMIVCAGYVMFEDLRKDSIPPEESHREVLGLD